MNKENSIPVIYTPDNEPYLGRKLLFHFDQIISSAMEQNANAALTSQGKSLSDQQKMACTIIPQAVSLMLSIRELIRQGYLFGAKVMIRSLVERTTILLYIYHYPEEIEKWNRGWQYRDAPNLAKMFEKINEKNSKPFNVKGYELTAGMNSILHAKPDSAYLNLVKTDTGSIGFASSKILNNPNLCDGICADIIPWIAVVQGMMTYYFPKD